VNKLTNSPVGPCSRHHWYCVLGKLTRLRRGFELTIQLPINFVLPDIQPLLEVASLQPMPLLYKTVTKSSGAALGLTFLSTSLSTMLTGLG
jgi:hypothetical protein